MRAGCFAESRVINLLNRRFVNFYYNTGGPGLGKDPSAAAFAKGKTSNVYAFFAAFDPTGEAFGATELYASKDETFAFLVKLLREHPGFDKNTPAEQRVLDLAKEKPEDPQSQVAAGQLLEELGRYEAAAPCYRRALASKPDKGAHAEAYRGLLRMARYEREWDVIENLCHAIESDPMARTLGLEADIGMERGYHLNAKGQHAELRKLMDETIKKHGMTQRLSELHFYAGVACFFLKDVDWASYHWCWVVENLPDDRLNRRCFIAAAHKGMPYQNPELSGYGAKLPGGNVDVINRAYRDAKQSYDRLKDLY